MPDQAPAPTGVRGVLHRFRVLVNPLLWMMGGADPRHRAEFLTAADLAAKELDERPIGEHGPGEALER